jgi:uncharacterized protein YndB with AHSA1/START domain
MKTIIHCVHVHSSPSDVFRALTTEGGVRGWWTRKAVVEPGEGGTIRFTFHGDFNPHMKQTRLEPGQRVEWLCTSGHANWQDNQFRFVLEERNGETMLRFLQEYAQELDDEAYGTYNFNWGYYLNSLKLYCETGAGTPYDPDDG